MTFKSGNPEVFRLLGEHAGVGLWDCLVVDGDPLGPDSFWSWSSEYRRLTGVTMDEMPDGVRPRGHRYHPDDAEAATAAFLNAVADSGTISRYDINFRMLHGDGAYRWFRAIGNVTHDAAGIATRICGVLIDVHESETAAELQRHANREVERLAQAHAASQERFRQIAATSPDAIVCTDKNGIITFWNDAATRGIGFTAREMIARNILTLVPPDMRSASHHLRRQLMESGKVHELDALHRDGRRISIDISLSTWFEDGEPCFGFIGRDASERKAKEALLADLARRDPLTELPNRAALDYWIEARLAEGSPFCVLMVDLDGFKEVNDTFGHEAGDAALKIAAERMAACLRDGDLLARFGGDEFGIVLTDGDESRAASVAGAVIRTVSLPMEIETMQVAIGASVGIAVAPRDGRHAAALLSAADVALYASKKGGRGCFHRFTPQLRQRAVFNDAIQCQLRRAVSNGEFELFYQPQYHICDHRMIGAEALLRWRHPREGLIAPDSFLPSLERSVFVSHVGDIVLEKACRQAANWRGLAPDFRMAVNLFAVQLRDRTFPGRVSAILAWHGLPAAALELELPETLRLHMTADMTAVLSELTEMGVGIALDDFGTGHASLSHLQHIPLTRLKIDRSFVQGMMSSTVDAAAVEAILLIGRRLGASVVAEGIETQEQEEQLLMDGCSVGQGYLFGRPMPASDFAARFLSQSRGHSPSDRPTESILGAENHAARPGSGQLPSSCPALDARSLFQ
ncbi:putative bifunctional diguanylate cyclase/phosphodiesterase [Aureimonas sp. D3]|uniref:putative bifunctional diguanylate cyclase/phosphodiesterase n=1 Tax=Aureimonas sp. D3 TaxID=1638164 RepID=UPI000783B4D5|nr:EAL domain-containing protein [Aureimonas sp. D3]